jgi:ATP-binding cassette, subfamily C (CFTR/MRP), member 4
LGEKQLLCLGRAIARKAKILVCDEATANVDLETDNFIQRKLREKFAHCTVLMVAHRLATIIDADRILVMADGEAKEFDHPYLLLVKSPGDDKITRESHFASIVLEHDAQTSLLLFEKAQDSYRT